MDLEDCEEDLSVVFNKFCNNDFNEFLNIAKNKKYVNIIEIVSVVLEHFTLNKSRDTPEEFKNIKEFSYGNESF